MEKTICVAKIIDNYTLVLNVGSDDGFKVGDKFLIYSLDDEPLIDPITKENLGFLEIPKGTGAITYIQDKMCIIKSTNYKSTKRKNQKLFPIGIYTAEDDTPRELEPFDLVEIRDRAKQI